MIVLSLFILIALVKNHALVVLGATCGLMLWYQNVLPLLLPFMIISNVLLLQARKKQVKREENAIFYTLLLGLFCGYPLGAKCAADFTKCGLMRRKTANALLPLCNNVSPMFLSGYICHAVLEDGISFFTALFFIYLPYFIFMAFHTLLRPYLPASNKKNIHIKKMSASNKIITHTKKMTAPKEKNTQTKKTPAPKEKITQTDTPQSADTESLLLSSIRQITLVGVYIMLCSILIALLCSCQRLPESVRAICAGLLEITQGSRQVMAQFSNFPIKIKTALILAMTSFGGVSSVLQTGQVIQNTGLSLLHYVATKLFCATTTGLLCFLLV